MDTLKETWGGEGRNLLTLAHTPRIKTALFVYTHEQRSH